MKSLTKNNSVKGFSLGSKLGMILFAMAFSSLAMAQATGGGGDFADTGGTISKFFKNIVGLLNLASIAVVTIAVIFAGYQIAFANKRISDVASILIGGVLIGAAAQIAKMLIGGA
jgi:type IV secretion system protein VirB2